MIAPPPMPDASVPLRREELDDAFEDANLDRWSAQRLAIAVLEAHGDRMTGAEVVATLQRLTPRHNLKQDSSRYWRRGAPVQQQTDGSWLLDADHRHVLSARRAVRQLLVRKRADRARDTEPAPVAEQRAIDVRDEAAPAPRLAALRRVLLHAFPPERPQAVVLVDVAQRQLSSFMGSELDAARDRLTQFDLIGAVNVRALLRKLGLEPQRWQLAELGPPHKTRTVHRAGRTLTITLPLLVAGTCGVAQPLGDARRLQDYLKRGKTSKLRRRLEADARALHAYYQYGRLHRGVRLRWGFHDERIAVPWIHADEPSLLALLAAAHQQGRAVEVVAGRAPGWADPWSRARRCRVVQQSPWHYCLLDVDERVIDEWDVQAVRLAPP